MSLAAPIATLPDAPLQRARWLALAGLTSLVALGLAWELWLAPTGRGTWAVKVLPLAAAAAGLWHHRLHTCRWLALLVWLYFCEGVVRATTERGSSQALAVAQTALSLLLFVACVHYVRLRQRAA